MSILAFAAIGDALGAPYEFNEHDPRDPQGVVLRPYGPPSRRHAAGRWTDDTGQAIALAAALLQGDLLTEGGQDLFLGNLIRWLQEDGAGVGMQTAALLRSVAAAPTPKASLAKRTTRDYLRMAPDNAAGNGSLMRCYPLALVEGSREAVAEAARETSLITHGDPRCGDACVLWVELLREAEATGALVPTAGLDLIPQERRGAWDALIQEALEEESEVFSSRGWWVVPTFQQALSAVAAHEGEVREAPFAVFEEIALAEEGDTDTVAAVAGSLVGALGARLEALPPTLVEQVHGPWPFPMRVGHLEALEEALRQVRLS